MRPLTRCLLAVLPVLALAGCFESARPLYAGMTPLRPFRDGAVLVSQGENETGTVREVAPGAYRFVDAKDKTDNDVEPLRFFALPGAAAGTMVSQTKFNNDCSPRSACTPIYVYALWRMTGRRVDVTNPDCSKVQGVAQLPGVKVKKTDCGFADRATLERAMTLVLAARLKPDNVYLLRP